MKSYLPGDTPLLSPRDVNFLLYEWLEVESSCKRPTGRLWSTGAPETAQANSTAYLESVGHVVLAWIWLEQA